MRFRRSLAGLACLSTLLWTPQILADSAIATFNTLHGGWNNGKDLTSVAQVLSRFDLVALQEVMDADFADELADRLSTQTGESWAALTSDTVGRSSYQEGYAFVYRESQISYDGGATLYLDPGDRFAREPFSAQFTERDNGHRFVAGTVHIIYGDSAADRTPEIRTLDAYWKWLGETFSGRDRLLLGDFNTPPSDVAWRLLDREATPAVTRGATTLSKTNGRYSSLYDNIWYSQDFGVTGSGIAKFPEWLQLTHVQARDTVSDHAPVYILTGSATLRGQGGAQSEPRRGSAVAGHQAKARASERDCIDINQASSDALDRLDHVGPARAKAIISARPYAGLEDLTRVSGLSASRVDAIRAQHLTCQR